MQFADHYLVIKDVHVGLALTSGSLFAIRGLTVLAGFRFGTWAPVRYLSYTIDTALLTLALMLLTVLKGAPFSMAWFGTKLVLIVCYVVLGSLALKRARTKQGKAVAFVCALLCFAMIYAIARQHDPLGFLSYYF